jgi:glutamate racemase
MQSIVFFDSGVGGLTVLKDAMRILPNESYVYYSDGENNPYGIKSSDEIKLLVTDAVKFITDAVDLKALVLACNTATSVVVHELRQNYEFPIIGMEPAVKPAAELCDKSRILVCATERTLREEKLERLISGLMIQDRITKLSLQGLVSYAESGIFYDDSVMNYLNEKFKNFEWDKYTAVVLGCTHFIYFKEQISFLIPDEVKVLDGNWGTVQRLKQLIVENKEVGATALKFYESKNPRSLNTIKPYLDYLEI